MSKQIIRYLSLLAVFSTIGAGSCGQPARPSEALATPSTSATSAVALTPTSPSQLIDLPPPRQEGAFSLEEVLAKRRSVRQFSDDPLALEQLGQLLWAAQGITHPAGLRTAPSAGALYPLEVYAVTEQAVYHYEPQGHCLKVQIQGDVHAGLYEAALRQEAVRDAPVVIVITGVYARTAKKYGEERSPRYVHLEAGHAAQNILLQAVALDLGAVPIGAFYDDQVQQVLELPPDHQPLYLIPTGHALDQ